MGPQTVRALEFQPSRKKLFSEIKEAIKVPIKFIHVLRNPYDIVSTIVFRRSKRKDLKTPVRMCLLNICTV